MFLAIKIFCGFFPQIGNKIDEIQQAVIRVSGCSSQSKFELKNISASLGFYDNWEIYAT